MGRWGLAAAAVFIILAAPARGGAAITFVQHVGANGDATSGTSISVTVPAGGVAANDTLVVVFAMDPTSGTVSCGDSRGNTYAKDADVTNGSGTSGVRTVIFSAPIATPLLAGDTITVTHPTAAAKAISANEFSDLAPSGATDRTATATGTSTTASSGFTTATNQVDELLIGAVGVETSSDEAFTPGTGYAALTAGSSGTAVGPTSNVTVNPEYRVVAAKGSYSGDGTLAVSRLWGAAIATYRAKCGNGTVDAGEACDKSAANSACCSATCQLEIAGTVCRAASDLCDAAETCTGSSAACPADSVQLSGTICRAASDLCDAAETCSGASTACPTDALHPAGTVCRAVADACDLAEVCTGSGTTCPADTGVPGCSGPPPGVAFVKSVGTGGDAISSTAIAVTVPAGGVAADNTLIVVFTMDPASGTVSCGDSQGNVYAKDADVTNGSGTSGVRTVVFSAPITTLLVAGDTITVNHPTVVAKAISVNEFAGLAPSGALDRTATATGTSTTPFSGFTAATNQAEELLVGAVGVETGSSEGFAPGAGFTPLRQGSSGAVPTVTTNVTVNPEYRVVAAKGSYSAGGSISPSRLWGAVIATYRAKCGNGTVDAGEGCDKNAANSACCSASCQLETSGIVCRAASAVCDAAETCTGSSAACPADGFQPSGTICRAASDLCDAAETCTGASTACPADALHPAGTVCRAAADACDLAELCTGASASCAADAFQPAGTVCRGAADACDLAELCTGASASCPADVSTPGCSGPPPGIAFIKHVGSAGDTASSTETSVTVPGGGVVVDDALIVVFAMDPTSGTVSCGDSRGNVYTKDADVTNGSGTSGVRTVIFSASITTPLAAGDRITVTHPAVAAKAMSVNEFAGLSGVLDRTATGTGTSTTTSSGFTTATRQADELLLGVVGVETQPTEPFTPDAGATPLPRGSSGTTGAATANVTLNPEFRILSTIGSYAAGGSINPSRLWGAVIATYRAKCGNGTVDAGEACDKSAANSACCSATCQLEIAGTVCRAASDLCDAAETCTGSSAACPADSVQPSGTICRAASDLCDAAETCSGASTACPTDALHPAGTVCRAVADACDLAEVCTGSGTTCPADTGVPGCSGPPPGVAFVKSVGTGGDAISSTAIAVTVPAGGVAADNTLIVVFTMDPASGTVSCGDSQGNVYAKDADVTNGSGTSGVRTVVFSAPITTLLVAGDTITVNHPTVVAKAISVNEFAGLAPSGALDRTATATGTSTTPSSGFTAATNQLDELLVGVAGVETHGVDPFVGAAGYTPLPRTSSGSAGGATANVSLNPQFRVVSLKGSHAAGGTIAPSRLWGAAIATYRAKCGNGTVDAGEACDKSAANSACCSATCQLETAGTLCRATSDLCDAAETCTGSSGACPADGFVSAGSVCRAAVGPCDVAETCAGTASACPSDVLRPAGTVCRSASGVCDVAEICSGALTTCPADVLMPAGAVCRAKTGACDVAEACTGSGGSCPGDGKSTAVCRSAAGICDVQESCNGLGDECPPDAFRPASTVCRPAAATCDLAEHCTGTSTSCPADAAEPDSDGDGVCDTSDHCPTDADAPEDDADADGLGDACDPCTNIVPVTISAPELTIAKLDTPGGDDHLTFEGRMRLPTSPPIDPAEKGLRLLVDDALGGRVLDVLLPGGYDATAHAGWKAKRRGTVWRYRDPAARFGIARVYIMSNPSVPGLIRFRVDAVGGSYPVSSWQDSTPPARLPLAVTLVIDTPIARSGQCGEASFPSQCAFNDSGKLLRCK